MPIGLLDTAENKINNMGLFSILKGDISHFNNNAVPVLNDIFARLSALEESTEKEILLKMFSTAHGGVDILFHPDKGIIKYKVKSFNKEAFYVIYEMLVLFLILSLKNVKFEKADNLKDIFIKAVGRTEECNALWNELESKKDDERIFKPLYEKISSYTEGLKREDELAFVSAFHDYVQVFLKTI